MSAAREWSVASLFRRRLSIQSGQVIVFVAILALFLVAVVGLALDRSFVVMTHQQLQHAADAAALAGARLVQSEHGLDESYAQTRLAALQVARANDAAGDGIVLDVNTGNDPAGDIVVGWWDEPSGSFMPGTSAPNAVRVRARRSAGSPGGPLGLIFGPGLGMDAVDVSAVATAVTGGKASPVVLVLDPTGAAALSLRGTNLLDATHGLVQVNSDNHCAVKLVGTPTILASKVAATGGVCAAEGLIDGVVQEGAPVVADPLSGVLGDHASWTSLAQSLDEPLGPQGTIRDSGTYGPGRYPGGLLLEGQATVRLLPGVYVLGGPGLRMLGGAQLSGEGTALLVEEGGTVDIRGTASATWTAMTDGPLAGVALFTCRHNTGLAASIGGDGTVSIGGTVYVPSGTLRLAGGPDKSVGSLVVHRLQDSGTPSLKVLGPGPQSPEPVTYLVE